MAFFRQYVAPLIAVLGFLIALFFVSARIFLPSDMAAPAPVDTPAQVAAPSNSQATLGAPEMSASLSMLIKGALID
ncbi:MAG: hypothetical protein NZ772_11425 [Cyanobacteria bacterium]|nr:hypothetical protein [Cyanobacteriota bacterium]MDW8202038.1 hypothetical protein [Cyanobacteriota bacterium SKYGB_h_bin112]